MSLAIIIYNRNCLQRNGDLGLSISVEDSNSECEEQLHPSLECTLNSDTELDRT